ncbi:MAG: AMP-binding protein [Solirubrobacterales bacterium]|nr:AMP-binding protein [Solirubrobacterales bacterium]
MDLVPKTLSRPVGRIGAAAQNALEVARFGGLDTHEQPSPYGVVSEQRVYRLRRYYPDADKSGRAPVLLVPPLMLASEIYDVSAQTSAVTLLHQHGADPWLVDFGAPERQEGGLERTLGDHILAVSEAIDSVAEHTGQDVNLAGYSQGGMFCYQAAAYRRSDRLASLITFGSPVDTQVGMPFGVPESLAALGAGVLSDSALADLLPALPAWASRVGFHLFDPVKAVRSRIEFIMRLHDRDALLPREGQRRFLEDEGWVAWPGPALVEFLQQFIHHNRMLEGGFVVEDRLLSLADISCPIMSVVGTVDEIAPAAGVRAIRRAAPRADVYELALRAGHFGLVVGHVANEQTWPAVAGWTAWASGHGELPAELSRCDGDAEAAGEAKRAGGTGRVGYGLELAGSVSSSIVRQTLNTAAQGVGGTVGVAREVIGQMPRLARLAQIKPDTRISLGLLVEERRRRNPERIFFVFGDRAYTAEDINERIDNVVRGLIAIGIRQGDRVGVLMSARPTALALAVAINRLGAVAVMLRPDGDVPREIELGGVSHIVADPERAQIATDHGVVHTFVLGGGGGPRDLGVPFTTDMEQIDPENVELPAWYEPNPGRGSDIAFVVFTGEGDGTRVHRISNRRWSMSAFGTASSAALSADDTVYSSTPMYHPSGLMTSIGGAIAGGSRLALSTHFDPTTFWEETRRYGVTVASYTWTMLRELVEAPEDPGEHHHGVRLFIGSGMPSGLWQRVQERFRPARVLEFYAATEAGAILVNVSGAKPGSLGRPLPGSAEIRLAAYDAQARSYVYGLDGLVRDCADNEPGMLMVRTQNTNSSGAGSNRVLRGVFERGDAWMEMGDLFERDSDGDYWRLDNVVDVIRTVDGPVFSAPITRALAELPAVGLALAYGVSLNGAQIPVAAVTLRPGHELRQRDITAAVAGLAQDQRPDVVHQVDSIPVTTWYRPLAGPLRAQGVPRAGDDAHPAWYLDRSTGGYRPLTETARSGLVAVTD